MSWNKNTVSFSPIDMIVGVLSDLKIPYQLSVLATVKGYGLNDDYLDLPDWKIRRLQFKNTVYLEQIEQDADCDTDDIITAHKFTIETEPEDWQPILRTNKLEG